MSGNTASFDYTSLPGSSVERVFKNPKNIMLIGLIAVLAVCMAVIKLLNDGPAWGEVKNVVVGMAMLIGGLVYLIYRTAMKDRQATRAEFAKRNNLTALNAPDFDKTLSPPLIYDLGYSVTFRSCYQGTFSGTPFQIVEAQVGKDTKHALTFSIVYLPVAKQLPNIVLDSHVNDAGLLSGLPLAYNENQRISLEGNFDKYFDLYAPEGAGIDALNLLSPDFMELLIQTGTSVDINIVQNGVFLVSSGNIYTKKRMEQLLTIAERLTHSLQHKMRSWSYTFAGDTYPVLKSRNASALRIGPRRLKVPYGATALILIVPVLIGIMLIDQDFSESPAMGFVVLGIGVLAVFYLWLIKRPR